MLLGEARGLVHGANDNDFGLRWVIALVVIGLPPGINSSGCLLALRARSALDSKAGRIDVDVTIYLGAVSVHLQVEAAMASRMAGSTLLRNLQ